MKDTSGRVYVVGAIEDASFPEEQKNRLEQALADARVDHLIETYPGARHGFAVPDHPVFDSGAAERHWAALFKLFGDFLTSRSPSNVKMDAASHPNLQLRKT